jgi:hypothetical protein
MGKDLIAVREYTRPGYRIKLSPKIDGFRRQENYDTKIIPARKADFLLVKLKTLIEAWKHIKTKG